MTDIREFMGHAPTHCTLCGARWADGCAPHCMNAAITTSGTGREPEGWSEQKSQPTKGSETL